MARFSKFLLVPTVALAVSLAGNCARAGDRGPTVLPAPAADMPRAAKPGKETVVFSGGCFWGVQAVFQHVRGVIDATSGYSGGEAKTAEYELVSTGTTGHAESVRVTYDPSKVTYGQLLQVFFSVAHNPTELNRQGPDEGTQYRSVVFFTTPNQQRVTAAYLAQQGITTRRLMTDNAFAYVRNRSLHELLAKHGIRQLTTRPYRPRTNGKVERFHQTMAREWAYGRPYRSHRERNQALPDWLDNYNRHRPHRSIGDRPPISRVHNVRG